MVCPDRRRIISLPFVSAAVTTNVWILPRVTKNSNALDVDAFIRKELESDSKDKQPQLSDDEALCKYGQPGKERGDACVRAGVPIQDVMGKKKSIVNAYGEVDRGSYTRCQQFYELEDEGYVKKTFCE
jgi:hypothetical protein